MTDYTWIGGTSSDSNTAANWSPAAVPTASDNVIFDTATANFDCVWTLSQINNITLNMSNHNLILDLANLEVRGVFHLDGNIAVDSSRVSVLVKFTGSGETLITFDDETAWVNGDTDKAKTTFEILGTASNIMFQNGEYPIVKIGTGTTVSPHVPSAPNNIYTETDFYQLTFAATGKFAETSALVYASDPKEERSKVFRIRSIGTWSVERFEGGKAIWIFYATTAGFELPLSGSNISTATSFESKVAQIQVVATQIGQKIKVPPGPHYLEKLTIDVGVMCICDRQIAELHMTNRPTIDGAWQFVQITDGIYRSAKEDMILPITHGGTGQKNAQDAINALTQVSAATDEYVLTKDTTTGDAIWKAAAGGGGGSSTLSGLTDTTITSPEEPQILVYDDASGTWLNDTNDRLFIRVYNDTASTLSKGKAVYITGFQNANVAKVELAKADSSATMPAVGVIWEDVSAGAEGYIVALGKANGIAANFTAGDTLYVSPTTAGELTNTRPTSASHLVQNVGILFKPDASNAVIKVTGVGRTNDIPNQFTVAGTITASSLITSGGTSSDFVKGDGSLDSNTYLTSYSETDPIFAASEAALLQNGDKAAIDGALQTTGGTMTGEIEGTTITLNAVPADPATDDKVRLGESGATQNMLRIQTNDGYLDIGPNNSGYSHFYTNRNTFYMNKPLVVDGGGQIFAYNDGLKLGTGSSVGAGTVAINVADGSTNVEVVGTLRQGAVASAVLVADGNGDIIGASNLQDIAYLGPGQAQIDGFSPITSGAAWGPPGPPATIQEAIDRIASALANPGFVIGTPIP